MSDEPQMFTDISHTIGMVETWVELIRVIKDQVILNSNFLLKIYIYCI